MTAKRRFVQFLCTGRGTHKERRLRRFRWEALTETIAAGPGPIYNSGDIEAWNEWVEMLHVDMAAGVSAHLIEDDRVRDVDGRPMSHHGDLANYVADNAAEERFGTYAFRCPTCRRNLPLKRANLEQARARGDVPRC
ncbi:hypothetical protein G5V59_25640 [Nocardioides sp. W3-2-3]|uniref:hypothetical protein n=1 Tax=Nocardioides convexus TaxID=2712224 RepID=UPI0024184FB7|nr:hypothetical protein [Nocardioides convexus]NHA01884.1 hypothetical protein [Nocardioides convexus]